MLRGADVCMQDRRTERNPTPDLPGAVGGWGGRAKELRGHAWPEEIQGLLKS